MLQNRAPRRAIALVSLAALLSGCFVYVPTELASVPNGAQVQVHLTPRAQVELSQRGRRVDETVKGTLSERRGDALLIKVPIASEQEGFFRSAIEQELPVAQADVVGIDLRRFSGARTTLLVGASAAGAALVVLTVIAASHGGGAPPGPGPDELRLPLFQIPVW